MVTPDFNWHGWLQAHNKDPRGGRGRNPWKQNWTEDRNTNYEPAPKGKRGEGAGPAPGKLGHGHNPNGDPKRPNYAAPNPNQAGYSGNAVGAVGAYPGIPRGRAAKIVKGQMRELLRGYRQERSQVRANQANDIRDVNQFTDQTMSGLGYINDQMAAYMASQAAAIQQNLTNTASTVGQVDANTQGQISSTNDQLRNAFLARMQSMGMGTEATVDPAWQQTVNSQLTAAQQAAGNNQSTIATSAGNAANLAALQQGAIAGSTANARGKALIAQQNALNEIGDDSRSQIGDIMADIHSARKGKGAAINELLEQMLAGDYDRWANTTDMQFQHSMANRQFAADQRSQRLAMLQAAAEAQTGATGWQAAYNAPWRPNQNNPNRPYGSPRGGPGKKKPPPKKLPTGYDYYPGPLSPAGS